MWRRSQQQSESKQRNRSATADANPTADATSMANANPPCGPEVRQCPAPADPPQSGLGFRDLSQANARRVAALRQVDADRVVLPSRPRNTLRSLSRSRPASMRTNRIDGRIEGLRRPNTLERDRIPFEPVTRPASVSSTTYSRNCCRRCDWANALLANMRSSCARTPCIDLAEVPHRDPNLNPSMP